MNNKKKQFIEEFSDNFSELFVEMFIIRYGPIKNFDEFVEDFRTCQVLTKRKMVKLITKKLAKTISTK